MGSVSGHRRKCAERPESFAVEFETSIVSIRLVDRADLASNYLTTLSFTVAPDA
jgi:hypothetical protein